MKRITKVLILLLALCMIIPCFAACNNNNKKKDPNQTTPPSGDVTTPPVEDTIDMPEVVNMNGHVYKAYVRQQAGTSPDAHNAQIQNGNNDYRCVDFWVDEANSETDVISFAVFNRNKRIEAENARIAAEQERVSAETARKTSEQNRVSAWANALGIKEIYINNVDENKQYVYQLQIVNGKPVLFYEEATAN